jgi:hypothetical protein
MNIGVVKTAMKTGKVAEVRKLFEAAWAESAATR